ncbi:hypothetical protein Hdeb2414_s0010g00343931 [Helianthus debilis subsp. tardiflorus]
MPRFCTLLQLNKSAQSLHKVLPTFMPNRLIGKSDRVSASEIVTAVNNTSDNFSIGTKNLIFDYLGYFATQRLFNQVSQLPKRKLCNQT